MINEMVNVMPKNEPPDSTPAPDVNHVLDALRMIEGVLGDAPAAPAPAASSEPQFRLTLGEALNLIPAAHHTTPPTETETVQRLTITLDDLFAQLAKGRVKMAVADLAYHIPTHLLQHAAYSDRTEISLPLALVVQSIGNTAFRKRTTQNTRFYDISSLDDPFTKPPPKPIEPAETDPVLPVPPKPVPEPTPEPVPVPETPRQPVTIPVTPAPPPAVVPPPLPPPLPIAATPPAEPPEPASPPAPDWAPVPAPARTTPTPLPARTMDPAAVIQSDETTYPALPGTINLNTATVDTLMTLPGISRPVAARIVLYRTEHGPYPSVFDLSKVPRLGRKVFRALTGIPWNPRREHRQTRLAQWLELPLSQTGDLRAIAAVVAGVDGVDGCMLSDNDGLLLAESGTGTQAEALGAVIPRTVSQIMETLRLATLDELDSISLGVHDKLYTVVAMPHMVLTAIHEENKITKAQLIFVRRVARELNWLMSPRVMAGPPAGPE